MTAPSPSEAERIAAGLSEAQRRAMTVMARTPETYWSEAIPARTYGMDATRLSRLGLCSSFSRSGDNARPLTPLGLAVRASLLKEGRGA
jgi:hypothetical protein